MKKIIFSLILILSLSLTSCITTSVADRYNCLFSTYRYNYYYYDMLGFSHTTTYPYKVLKDSSNGRCYIRYYYYGALIKFYI